jgi:hypothetical protein
MLKQRAKKTALLAESLVYMVKKDEKTSIHLIACD